MTLGPAILVPILLVFGSVFLAAVVLAAAVVAGLISVGYARWKTTVSCSSPVIATESGLAVFDPAEDGND